LAQVQSLQVFDRWGNQVFYNENFEPNEAISGWDGTFRNERMQTGVFVYYAIVEFQDGSTELFKGDVTLME
jgi:gliding motility-associated-like protein